MKYLVDVERPVFLHFLNREAASAAGRNHDLLRDLRAIDLMLISHCSGMTVNISQMIEYANDLPELQGVLLKLSIGGILITTSRESNIADFLQSRRTMYRHVEARYPMYFQDSSNVESFSIAHANSFSMTRLLRRDILETTPSELPLIGRRARDSDLASFTSEIDTIKEVLFKERDIAVTRGNLSVFTDSSKVDGAKIDAVGRVFSALYNEHYSNNHMAATCTGLGDVGYVDDTKLFPHYDVPVLKGIIYALDWEPVRANSPDLGEELVARYGSLEHREFVEALHAFVSAAYRSVVSRSNLIEVGPESEVAMRAKVLNYAVAVLKAVERSRRPQNLLSFYSSATDVIIAAASQEAEREPGFKVAWEENMPPKRKVRLLVVTATDKEDDAVLHAIKTAGFRSGGMLALGQGYGQAYLRGSSREIIHVRSSAGSVGSSGSELVTSEAITASGVNMVLAVGICFGLLEEKHQIGDVLVSEKIADYEFTREGVTELRERGPRMDAGPKLLSATRIARRNRESDEFGIHHGLMLSGLKLVDNPDFRAALKTRFPDAIGGEMEASGVMAAAARSGTEWIIIKAICDWGMGKDDSEQVAAASNAADFAVKVMEHVFDAEVSRK